MGTGTIRHIAVRISDTALAHDLAKLLTRLDYRICSGTCSGSGQHLCVVDAYRLSHDLSSHPRVLAARRLSPELIDLCVCQHGLGIVLPSQSLLELKAVMDTALMMARRQDALESTYRRWWRKWQDRRKITRAKERLMRMHGLDETFAYHMIRQEAMRSRRTLGAVAKGIVTEDESRV
jgi:hypothetical protein